jgi:hypothetical protein
MAYSFPQKAFETHLAALQHDASLADVRNLIPTK